MPTIDVLIPTVNRLLPLTMTLAGVAAQTHADLRVIVADQSDAPAAAEPALRALQYVIERRGGAVEWHRRDRRLGIAEQRDYLLRQAIAASVLLLDDDVFLEPWVVAALEQTLRTEGCGFVGAFPVGMSFRDDIRPHHQRVEFWEGPVRPETVNPETPEWERASLHSAANLYHASLRLAPGEIRRYKVAWVAGCGLYDRTKLEAVGGFSFWPRLPRYHSGEDVLVQNLLQRRWGACALMPSGAYHAEAPTTVLNAAGGIDGHALALLAEMVERYAPETGPVPAFVPR